MVLTNYWTEERSVPLSAHDQALLNSLKPESVVTAFKHKDWRPMLKHQLPPSLRNVEATALIKGDSHMVVYTGDAWQMRKLETVKAFAAAEDISVSEAINYLVGFQDTMQSV